MVYTKNVIKLWINPSRFYKKIITATEISTVISQFQVKYIYIYIYKTEQSMY